MKSKKEKANHIFELAVWVFAIALIGIGGFIELFALFKLPTLASVAKICFDVDMLFFAFSSMGLFITEDWKI